MEGEVWGWGAQARVGVGGPKAGSRGVGLGRSGVGGGQELRRKGRSGTPRGWSRIPGAEGRRAVGPVLTREGARALAPRRAVPRPPVARGDGPGPRGALCSSTGAPAAGPGERGSAAAGAGRGVARARGRQGAAGAAAGVAQSAAPGTAQSAAPGTTARGGRGVPQAAVGGIQAGPPAGAAVRGAATARAGAGAPGAGHGVRGEEGQRVARARLGSRGPAPLRVSESHRPALAVRAPQVIKTRGPHPGPRPCGTSRAVQGRLCPGTLGPLSGPHLGPPSAPNIRCPPAERPQPTRECALVSPGSLVGPDPPPRGFPASASVPAHPDILRLWSRIFAEGGVSRKDPPTPSVPFLLVTFPNLHVVFIWFKNLYFASNYPR